VVFSDWQGSKEEAVRHFLTLLFFKVVSVLMDERLRFVLLAGPSLLFTEVIEFILIVSWMLKFLKVSRSS
jgi:hypothetical protein